MEEAEVDTGGAEAVPERLSGSERAETVGEDTDPGPTARGSFEKAGEGPAGLVVPEDVRLEEHLVFCRFDRRAHRRERVVSVRVERDRVVRVEGRGVDSLDEPRELGIAKAARNLFREGAH